MGNVVHFAARRRRPRPIFFDRSDLARLLSLYSQRVRQGVWKDYALGADDGMAVFSVFGRAAGPAYTVIKYAAGEDGRSEYALCRGPRLLGRGATLDAVLRRFAPALTVVRPPGAPAGYSSMSSWPPSTHLK